MKSHLFRASSSFPTPNSSDGGLQDVQPRFTFTTMALNKVLLPVNQHGKPRERKPHPPPRASNLSSPVTAQRAHHWAWNLTVWTYEKGVCCTLPVNQALHQRIYVQYLILYLSLSFWEDNAIQSLLPGGSNEDIKVEGYSGVKHRWVEVRRTQNPPC